MSSQGQRFRRRAVRRGYKVDEVDDFLDRVEATLNGVPGASVAAQDVHDVVFRVRFGGYDEWQVDLHLDRVERQLAELHERPPAPGRGAELRSALGQGPGPGNPGGDRLGPPPLPTRTPATAAPVSGMPRFDQPRYDEPTYNTGQPPQRFDEPAYNSGPPQPQRFDEPAYNTGPQPPQRYDEPTYNTGAQPRYDEPTFMSPPPQQQPAPFDGYDQPRQPRQDPSGEIRMDRRPEPPRDSYGSAPGGFAGGQPPSPNQSGYGQPGGGFGGPPVGGGFGAPPPAATPSLGPDAQRIDQLRRTFQLRRFGSGYDPAQVDRIFEGVLGALSGRGPGAVGDAELDPGRLNLVPGGYYEAEVDQAMREARDILGRR
jgi:DivIVA domain-containing protein